MTKADGDKRNISICLTLNKDEIEMYTQAKEKLSREKGTRISGRLLLSVLCFRYLHGNLEKSDSDNMLEDNNRMLKQIRDMVDVQIELNKTRISGEDEQ